jgi:hypothetical protein
MFTSQQNLALVQTELDRVFDQGFDSTYEDSAPGLATARTAEIFKVMRTDRRGEIEEIFKGSSLFPVIGETGVVPQQSAPIAANKLTTYVKDFASSIEISKDLFDDNMHNVWSRMVSNFGFKARVTQDDNAFAFFRGAFTTSLTADGVALISASHALIGGGTLSNLVSGALAPSTLNDAIVALAQQKDQAGVIMGCQPAYLLVPSSLFATARQVVGSILLANTGNNNINVIASDYGIRVYQSPYLGAAAGGSDTAWFLMARNHSVTRLIRQEIETRLRDWQYSNNRTYLYQANFREVVYAPDYVGVVGSTGV